MAYASPGSSRVPRRPSNAESYTGSLALDPGFSSDPSVIDFADALDNSTYQARHVPTSYVLPPTSSDSSSSVSSFQLQHPQPHRPLGDNSPVSFSSQNANPIMDPRLPHTQSTTSLASSFSGLSINTSTLHTQQSFSDARRAMQLGRLRNAPSQSSMRLSGASSGSQQSGASSMNPAPPPTAPLPLPPTLITPGNQSHLSNPPSRTISRQPSRTTNTSRQPSGYSESVPGSSEPKQTPNPVSKFVATPRLYGYNGDVVSPALMHWTRLGTHGQLPKRGFRAHSVTLVDQTAWLFGGQDQSGCWDDVWCLDLVTFMWYHPPMQGDIPPPCRAHTATYINNQILVFGGGNADKYYNHLYLLDTARYRWIKFDIQGEAPPARRAHTAVLYGTSLWVYGGGTGSCALTDLWSLDVEPDPSEWRWVCYRPKTPVHSASRTASRSNLSIGKTQRSRAPSNASEGSSAGRELRDTPTVKYVDGPWPPPRGYHTANVVNNSMVVLGGNDGGTTFDDLWLFDFRSKQWKEIVDRDGVNPRPKLLAHSATQIGSYLFVVGGHDTKRYTVDVRLFNLAELLYENKDIAGLHPKPRAYHGAILYDSRLFIFGGYDGTKEFSDVWYLDLAAQAYLELVTEFTMEDNDEGDDGILYEEGVVTPNLRSTL